jgi:hypothetical protein
MPVTNAHEIVAEALRTTLAAISTANGYAYTPDAVRRVLFWPDESALDATKDVLYFVRPTQKVTRAYDGRRLERAQEFRILCCKRFGEATEVPHLATGPVREQIASEMEADVVKALWADVRLGQPGYVIDAMAEAWSTDLDWYVERWVIVELRIVVRYQHPQDGR